MMVTRVRRVLLGRAYAWSVALILVCSVWLRWPTLENGFFSDDMSALAMAEGAYAAPRGKLDLFNFTDGTPQDHALLMRAGSLPWWTVSGLRLAMLRPLSSALMLVDRAAFGDEALFYHVHSLLWWLALMLMTAVLLRDLFSPAMASLTLLVFALEEGHTMPLGWLANRGTLVAMLFCLAGLRAHLRARRLGDRRAAWISCVCFSIALLSGEWAFPMLGYVLAFELIADRAPLLARLRALWPAAIPGLTFLACRSALGYGARNSGVYTDPLSEPARFMWMACQRLPVFFADLVFSIPAPWWGYNTPWRDQLLRLEWIPPHVWLRLPDWQTWHVLLGVVAMIASGLALRFGVLNRPEAERRELHWLLAGAFISLVPMVSSFPTSRLVLPAALACSAGAAAVLLAAGARVKRWTEQPGGAARLLGNSVLLGLVVYFQVWQAGARSYDDSRWARESYAAARRFMLDAEIDDARIGGQRMVIVSSIDHSTTIFAPYLRWFFGHPMPRAALTLSAAPFAHDVYRPAANVLELTSLGGTMLGSEFEQLYRAPRFGSRAGDQIDVGAMRVEILHTIDRRPQIVRFTFDASVEDPSFLFLYASPEGLVRARLPEVGERTRWRRPTYPSPGYSEAMRALRDPMVQCVGPRPPVDECRQGFFFADCGGAGPPVLGCRGSNDCRWFVNGCVAEDYETSSCRPERTCCIPNARRGSGGPWPFAMTSFTTEPPFSATLSANLNAWGRAGWDVARHLTIPVEVDFTLPPLTPGVHCSGLLDDPGPCGTGLVDVAIPRTKSLYFVFRTPRARPSWALTVEVVDDRAGALVARICRVPTLNADDLPGDCGQDREPVCATAGALRLNGFPVDPARVSQLTGRVVAAFADGVRVEAEF